MNNNDESSDEEVNENEDVPVSDTEQDQIVFESDDEENDLSFETDSDDLGLDYSESDEESISLDESSDESEDENLEKKSKNLDTPTTSKDNVSEKVKRNESSKNNINIKNTSDTLQTKKQSKKQKKTDKINKSDELNIGEVVQKDKVQNKRNLKSDIEKSKRKDNKNNTESNISNENNDKTIADQQVDEYEYDTSDEEDIRNTVGNIPMKWYDEYDHIGYNWDGKQIIKPQKGDQLDNFLKRMEDPDFWRTIKDPQTGQNVVLSEADIDLITRIQKGKIPDATFDEYGVSIFLIQ